MKLIPLQELEKAIQSIPQQWVENMGPVFDEGEYTVSIDELGSKISGIPIIDPIKEIDKMIEESRRDTDTMVLLELKSRLSPKL